MGRIKSALEIAMERTENVKGDKTSIGLFDAKQRGKRLANQYLAGEISAIEKEFKKAASKEEQRALKEGCFEVLVTQITLPSFPEDLKRLEAVGNGLSAVVENQRFSRLYQQFMGAVSQYLQEAARYDEAIKQQYAPKLRQKEDELARRFGRQIKLDPFQDPEFVAFYNQNINALKANYEAFIEEMQQQARELFE
ncbi:MAG: hypothetical protein LBB72_07275 [Spirochaetaceae bacterium]|jgi:hypothetical protein|nr:hypothetical protein [Spirochaetaceae bacterium]